MEKIKIKLLSDDAIMPKKATAGSIAYDVFAPEDTIVYKGRNVIPLDFAIELPSANFEAKIEPRSGFSAKGIEGYSYHKIQETVIDGHLVSGLGVRDVPCLAMKPGRYDADVIVGKIDSDYRGVVGVIIVNRDNRNFMVKKGTRIAQMTIYETPATEFVLTEELTATDRKGGFGSTGTNDKQ